MTDDRKRKTGGEFELLRGRLQDYADGLGSPPVILHDAGELVTLLREADAAIEALRAEVERLRTAGKRVTAAFRAHGEATPFTREIDRTRHECEAAILALDAALNLEPTP